MSKLDATYDKDNMYSESTFEKSLDESDLEMPMNG